MSVTPDTDRTAAGTRGAVPALRARTVRAPGRPARCTVSPVDVDEDRRTTAWLTVDETVVVPLDAVR